MINLNHRGGRLNSGVPSGDRAILGYKDEDSPLAGSEKEIGGAAVEHDSCRRSRGRLAGSVGNCNHERDNRSGAVVQSGSATGIVGNPPGTTWGRNQSPGVLQVGIRYGGPAGDIRHQVGGGVVLRKRQAGKH